MSENERGLKKRWQSKRSAAKAGASKGADAAISPAKPRQKARKLRWKGVLGTSSHLLRVLVFIMLVVTGATLSFTELGFVHLELPDGTVGYMVSLLQVVALGALLLGTLSGAGLGLVVGGVLYLHANILPLDHYELAFVTPLTSIIMFAVCGLLLGLLFAIALRNNPSRVKSVIYITIVCIVVSWMYSIGFAFNVLFSIAFGMALNASDVHVQETLASAAMQLGDMTFHAWSTALVMALACSIGDLIARRAIARKGSWSMRAVFSSWLCVVVALAFMTMSAASFAVASADGLNDAQSDMQSEVSYLNNQFKKSNERVRTLGSIIEQGGLDYDKVDEKLLAEASDLFEDAVLFEGYTQREDGTVIMLLEDMIYASDDERFKTQQFVDDVFSPSVIDAINRSKETGEMQRCIVYPPVTFDLSSEDEGGDEGEAKEPPNLDAQVYLAYLYAEDASITTYNDDGKEEPLEQTIFIMRSSDQVFSQRSTVMGGMTSTALVLLTVVFFVVFQLLNRLVARRIDETNATLARVTEGDLDARVEASDTQEFESLARGINTTVDSLKGLIAEAEARMDAELATAWAIQRAALPRIFPPFPDVLKFDIYAIIKPARQVGGDFYDFFLIGDDCDSQNGKLGFVVADVSGKGVPAALFMMKAKALLHDYVSTGMELGEAVEETNRQLVDGNDEGMFVTAWIGVLDYGSGHVDYVNAGHNPPLLWQREGGWRWMRQKSGPVLGLFEVPYRAYSIDCKPGDTFLLYTDGVTEAFDVNEELYGEERLMEVAEDGYRLHPRELLETLRTDVVAYSEGAEQSDDITILALEVGVPPEVTATLEVPAEVIELNRVIYFLHGELDRRLCPQRAQNQLDIAVEELFVNVCHYAYPDRNDGTVRIQRTYSADSQAITVDIIDEGIPYNPLEKPDAVMPSNIEDVPIGGLGILMAKRCTDEMRYEYADGCNIVTIVKKW